MVTLTPKESCSCPATGICYHILAVKMALHLDTDIDNKRNIKNLSMLRRNSRPRVAKKTGQKRPIKTDFEVQPAPDSILKSHSKDKDMYTPKISSTPISKIKRKSETKKSACKKIRFDDDINLSRISEEHTPNKKSDKLETIQELNLNLSLDVEVIANDMNDSNKINLSIALENNNISGEPSWKPEFNLNIGDKNLIENESGWLNDKIINCVQKLLCDDFPEVNGLQNTLHVPRYIDNSAIWRINKHLSKQQPPSAQIHHNGSNHWVMSYQQENNSSVIRQFKNK